MDLYEKAEELMEKEVYFVDILPEKVDKMRKLQYTDIEKFFLKRKNQKRIYQKFFSIVLKLNCYDSFEVLYKNKWQTNPLPQKLRKYLFKCRKDNGKNLTIIMKKENTMILIGGSTLSMRIYHPSEKVLNLLQKLAYGEGVFVRKVDGE